MPQKEKWVGFFICMITVLYLQAFLVHPIYANVEDIQTDGQNIHETDISDGKGESVGGGGENVPWWKKAWNKVKDIGNKGIDLIEDIGDSIGDQWNEFLDWSSDAWDSTKDWISDVGGDIGDWFKDVGSSIGEFFSDAWDWIQENEWVQTIAAGLLATVIIIGGAFLIVGSLPAIAVIVVVAGLAIGAGFLYQWLAGEDYNFFGALGASLVGGLVGYFGMTTGAFAAGWTWLRHTAGPAAWSWIKGTAVPWVVGRGSAAWSWMKTAAYPWIRGKAVSSWCWFKGLPAWGQIGTAYTRSGVLGRILKGLGIGSAAGAVSNLTLQIIKLWANGEAFSVKSLLVDTVAGGITGALLGPIIVPGLILSGSLVTVLGIYGGFENMIAEGFKTGDFLNWQNFVAGSLTAFLSVKLLSPIIGSIFDRFIKEPTGILEDSITKGIEEQIKNLINDGLPSNENNAPNKPSEKPTPKPTEPTDAQMEKNTPDSDIPSDNPTNNPTDRIEKNPVKNPMGGGVNPQPLN
ncbi:hypothetical protein WMO40_12155 [Bacillaceae bacterium CLA-AA-H227]|uniref:Uncharacterized protein n=1 Tax=Robertmurraya yapensis (ex Hitch et al 2024) TaxID=3133160 RepID=A0ACC6SBS5_9BACI